MNDEYFLNSMNAEHMKKPINIWNMYMKETTQRIDDVFFLPVSFDDDVNDYAIYCFVKRGSDFFFMLKYL